MLELEVEVEFTNIAGIDYVHSKRLIGAIKNKINGYVCNFFTLLNSFKGLRGLENMVRRLNFNYLKE